MEQAIQRIDHVAIIVYRENVAAYVDRLSAALGITFDEPAIVESTGVVAALAWDAGLEILAPLREEGRYWDRLQKYGEGTTIIVFGVKDMDAAQQRARDAGIEIGHQVQLGGTEPWFDRFSHFRESGMTMFDPPLPVSIALSQIEPRW
jgi:4-hydroxyphenylpyruvate dioxygenase-like putative hemolysin